MFVQAFVSHHMSLPFIHTWYMILTTTKIRVTIKGVCHITDKYIQFNQYFSFKSLLVSDGFSRYKWVQSICGIAMLGDLSTST